MTPISAVCPSCNKRLDFPPRSETKPFRCPSCMAWCAWLNATDEERNRGIIVRCSNCGNATCGNPYSPFPVIKKCCICQQVSPHLYGGVFDSSNLTAEALIGITDCGEIGALTTDPSGGVLATRFGQSNNIDWRIVGINDAWLKQVKIMDRNNGSL